MFNRVFLVVLDGLGIGGLNESNTLAHTIGDKYNLDVLELLGLTKLIGKDVKNSRGIYMRCKPNNNEDDSIYSHYEMMCAKIKYHYATYKDGFPLELISKIQKEIGTEVIGNINNETSKVLNELGQMHMKTGSPIIYTSNNSVIEVAAHEDIIAPEDLYEMCRAIFELSNKDYNISRVIARPFTGKEGSYVTTNKRKDFTKEAPTNVLDYLDKLHIQTICIGKIADLFGNKSVSVKIKTTDNIDSMMKLIDFAKGRFNGLLFANLSDFDTEYGHKRDKEGYLKALEEFNYYLPIFLKNLKKDDLLIITSDHGCDPTSSGYAHTKEMVPILIFSPIFKKGKMLDDRNTLSDIGATILDNFGIRNNIGLGNSIFNDLRN